MLSESEIQSEIQSQSQKESWKEAQTSTVNDYTYDHFICISATHIVLYGNTYTHLVICSPLLCLCALSFALLPPFASCLIRKSRIYPKGMLAFYFIIYITLLRSLYTVTAMLCKLITDVFQRDSKLQAMLPQLRNTRFTKITDSVLLPENDFILPFFPFIYFTQYYV
jgi:hypothetical protein